MSAQVVTDAKIYVDGYNFSADHNRIAVAYECDPKDVTTFSDTTRRNAGGLKSAGLSGRGFWQADSAAPKIDDIFYSKIGLTDVLATVAPNGADGDPAYFFKAMFANYKLSGDPGEYLPFDIEAKSAASLIRGTVLHTAAKTATGTGTSRQIGATSAAQKVYAGLHVIAASGTTPTLDVIVRSAAASNMASPTTRFTFAQKTAIGSQWLTPISGAITDQWWDVSFTIGGTTPSFTFIVVVGIL